MDEPERPQYDDTLDGQRPGVVPPSVALIDWCHLIEDFLDNLGISFDEFRTDFRGSWIFGYMEALSKAGMRPIWFCVSARVTSPWRFVHEPTGCLICVLPAPRIYRSIRSRMYNPYAYTVEKAVGPSHPFSRPFFAALKDVAPYLTTPLQWLARELRHERCQAILVQEYENPRFDVCVLLGRMMNLPVFATFQGGQFQYSVTERLCRPLSLRMCAGVIVGPRSEADRIAVRYGMPRSKIARIFNPIDVHVWTSGDRAAARMALNIPTAARVVVWHGRVVVSRKGLDVLLEAWDRLIRERPGTDLKLILIGTGNDAHVLRQHIEAARLHGLLWVDRFMSDPTEIRRYLSAADIFAFPSRDEGFPVAPLEAMASGLAVVAARAPGVADIFEDGEASGGLLVPVGDAGAFAHELGRVVDDRVWCQELGRRARRRAQEAFSLEAIGSQLAALLTRPCA